MNLQLKLQKVSKKRIYKQKNVQIWYWLICLEISKKKKGTFDVWTTKAHYER